ncbi:MAG: hypothetical protein EKK62_03230 [Acidimicrobiia bacterium]|nr:MAG: hypothetical protein EKK62_03230 [Acidimicrobiia bacterium]
MTIGIAPGWGCHAPHLAGAWVDGDGEADPVGMLTTAVPEEGGEDMGNGFALLRVDLAAPLHVPAGEVATLAIGIEGDECGAATSGPAEGARRWRQDTGWVEMSGRLVIGGEWCAE